MFVELIGMASRDWPAIPAQIKNKGEGSLTKGCLAYRGKAGVG